MEETDMMTNDSETVREVCALIGQIKEMQYFDDDGALFAFGYAVGYALGKRDGEDTVAEYYEGRRLRK